MIVQWHSNNILGGQIQRVLLCRQIVHYDFLLFIDIRYCLLIWFFSNIIKT